MLMKYTNKYLSKCIYGYDTHSIVAEGLTVMSAG